MKRGITIAACLALLLLSAPSEAAVQVRPGTPCKPRGVTRVVGDLKYTCVKRGTSLVWNNGTKVRQLQVDPVFQNFCERDPLVPSEWSAVQEWSLRYMRCARAYRYLPGTLPTATPSSEITGRSELLPIGRCKLSDPHGRPWSFAGFPRSPRLYTPTESANILVLGVQFTDYPAKGSPEADYGKYVRFMTDYLVNASDVPVKPVVRYSSSYLQTGRTAASFNAGPGRRVGPVTHADLVQRALDVFQEAGDYTDVDQLFVVPPPDIPQSLVSAHMDFYRPFSIQGHEIKSVFLHGPVALVPRSGDYWGQDPWISFIHEAVGHQVGVEDEFGAEIWNEVLQNPSKPIADKRALGAGTWGLMSGVSGDLLVWDKWLIGFVADAQVRCASSQTTTTHWLRPSTTKSNAEKALAIPVSDSRVVIVESMRSTGYNFKLPKATNGALVYVVDVTELNGGSPLGWGYGLYVQQPPSEPPNRLVGGIFLGNAALDVGESLVVEGVRIGVIEAGDYGDVVQVTPA